MKSEQDKQKQSKTLKTPSPTPPSFSALPPFPRSAERQGARLTVSSSQDVSPAAQERNPSPAPAWDHYHRR